MKKLKPLPKVRLTLNLEQFDFIQAAARTSAMCPKSPFHEQAPDLCAALDATIARAEAAAKRRKIAARAARNATYC